jgi:hypothetical protein
MREQGCMGLGTRGGCGVEFATATFEIRDATASLQHQPQSPTPPRLAATHSLRTTCQLVQRTLQSFLDSPAVAVIARDEHSELVGRTSCGRVRRRYPDPHEAS